MHIWYRPIELLQSSPPGWRRRRHRHRNSAPKTIQLAAIPCPGSNSCPFKMKSSAWPGKIWAKKCENIYNTTNHKVLVIFTTKRLQKKSVILLFHIKIKEFHAFFRNFKRLEAFHTDKKVPNNLSHEINFMETNRYFYKIIKS